MLPTADGADVGCLEIVPSRPEWDVDADNGPWQPAPRIQSLIELEALCKTEPEAELWQALTFGAFSDVCDVGNDFYGAGRFSYESILEFAQRRLRVRRHRHFEETTVPKGRSIDKDEESDLREAAERLLMDEINLFLKRVFEGVPVATKTPRKPAPKKPADGHIGDEEMIFPTDADDPEDNEWTDVQKDFAIKQLVCASPQNAIQWRSLQKSVRLTDEGLYIQLKEWFGQGVKRDNPPSYASASMGTPLVWLGQTHGKGTPSLSGPELLEVVRRSLGLLAPDVDENPRDVTFLSNVHRDAREATEEDVDEKTSEKSQLVQARKEIPLSQIFDSPYQTREEPPAEEIAELARSIEVNGLLKPLRLRQVGPNRYELIGGHRRSRALRHLGHKSATADVVECDDATASREVLADNDQVELNAIERARGLQRIWQQYEKAGKSQRQMAKDEGLDQGTLNNLLRLLETPPELQKRLIARDITQPQLRQLLRWVDRPEIVERFMHELIGKRFCKEGPIEDGDWERSLQAAIESRSRSITRSSGNWVPAGTPLFDCSKHLDDLEVIEYTIDGRKYKRAFNLKLWNQLQNQAKKAKKEREKKKEAAAKSRKPTAAPRTIKDSWQYREAFKESWHEPAWKRIHEVLKKSLTKDQRKRLVRLREYVRTDHPVEFSKALTLDEDAWLNAQYQDLVKNWITRYSGVPHNVEWCDICDIAAYLDIDLRHDWRPTRSLLEVCELPDLIDLTAEIDGIDHVDAKAGKKEVIDLLFKKWTPGHVPDFFSPDPKKKAAKKKGAK